MRHHTMTAPFTISATCAALLLAACDDGGSSAAPDAGVDAGDAIDPRYQPLVDTIVDELDDLGAPGMAVAIVEGGEVTFAHGFGTKHPDEDDPVLPTTLFRIGSVTKMITATGVLQQVAAGAVDLDAPVTDYLPDFALAGDETWAPSITVEHTLTHASAMRDYLVIDTPVTQQNDGALYDYLHGSFANLVYLMAPAGRMWNYSNPNFYLAGLINEVAADEYYAAYLDEHVFSPLGMDRTFFDPDDVLADGDYAYGDTTHWQTGEPFVAAPDAYDNYWARPAGYAFSSVLDLARMLGFLRAGDEAVLDDELRQAMVAPQIDTERFLDLSHYGYGVMVSQGFFMGSDWYDEPLISHGGAINGFAADLYYFPGCDLGYVTLANTDGAYFDHALLTAFETLCELPSGPAEPPDLEMGPEDYDTYAGEYLDELNVGAIVVTHAGDELLVSMPLLDDYGYSYDEVLAPSSPNNFYLTIEGYPSLTTFLLDGDGQAEYFRTRAFVGARVAATKGPVTAPGADPTAMIDRLLREGPPRLPPALRFRR